MPFLNKGTLTSYQVAPTTVLVYSLFSILSKAIDTNQNISDIISARPLYKNKHMGKC